MEKTIKERSEMDAKYLWNLSVVFQNDDAWYQTAEETKEKIKQYENYRDTFMNSAQSLYELFVLDEEVSRLLERLSTYAYFKSDEDNRNNTYLKMSGEIDNLYILAETNSAFIIPNLLKYQYTRLKNIWNKNHD